MKVVASEFPVDEKVTSLGTVDPLQVLFFVAIEGSWWQIYFFELGIYNFKFPQN